MKLLLDTNIFLEIILDQEKANDAKSLLLQAEQHDFYMSDYSLHSIDSIGLLMFRRNKHKDFQKFVEDVILDGGVEVLSLSPDKLKDIVQFSQKFSLDFDDAYQYTIAAKFETELVSFDGDFNRTDRGRRAPIELL
jgi:predicted nucleic acid-binding protein